MANSPGANKIDYNLKILWADDDRFMITAFSQMLGNIGCTNHSVVSGATAGEDAVKLIQSQHYDVVITDRRMPHVDGFSGMS